MPFDSRVKTVSQNQGKHQYEGEILFTSPRGGRRGIRIAITDTIMWPIQRVSREALNVSRFRRVAKRNGGAT